jgi:Lrp/AsnC family leucine-responsive transcriptional regulator
MTKDLDKRDWKLLYHLCRNARTSHNKLGKKLGMSRNAVAYRVERLIERRIISGFFTIIDHGLLGHSFYHVLLKVNATEEEEVALITYLKNHKNLLVADRLLGEWDFMLEFGCKGIEQFNLMMKELKQKFSGIIDRYEVHIVSDSFKVEQLPLELIKEGPAEIKVFSEAKSLVKLDELDKKLLFELNKDCTLPLNILAKKLGVTYETASARIKQLQKNKIILSFTARISLGKLGYDVYLVLLDLRNVSKGKESALKNHVNLNKKVRYAFMSGTKPSILLYLAVKNSEELDRFMRDIKEKFSDTIYNMKYMLSTQQIRYELFPQGFLEE